MENMSTMVTKQPKKVKKLSKSVRKLKKGWSRIKRTAKSLTKVFTKTRQSYNLNKVSTDDTIQNISNVFDDSGIDTIEGESDNNSVQDLSHVIGPEATYTSATVRRQYPPTTPSVQRQLNATFVKTVSLPKPIHVIQTKLATNSQSVTSIESQTKVNCAPQPELYTEPQTSIPVVKPPRTLKSQLYHSAEVFKQLDRRAIQMARQRCHDLEKVSLRLTQKCANDLEKARVLFRWVVAKDLISRNAKTLNWTVSTVGDVSDLKANREMFHRLFQTMCNYVGIRCEIIQGYSKGSGYKPGMRITGEAFRNCWTVVAIDNTWRLINCTWAARHMTSTKLSSCDEFYFLTDPKEHIFQHFPDESRWQLLEEPLPFREFTKLPLVKSPFFNNSLRFQTTYTSQVTSTNGKAQIKVSAPSGVKLGSRLQASRSTNSSHNDIGVSRRTNQNEAVFTLYSSRPGRYYLSIYATSAPEDTCLESACMFTVNFTNFNSQQL